MSFDPSLSASSWAFFDSNLRDCPGFINPRAFWLPQVVSSDSSLSAVLMVRPQPFGCPHGPFSTPTHVSVQVLLTPVLFGRSKSFPMTPTYLTVQVLLTPVRFGRSKSFPMTPTYVTVQVLLTPVLFSCSKSCPLIPACRLSSWIVSGPNLCDCPGLVDPSLCGCSKPLLTSAFLRLCRSND